MIDGDYCRLMARYNRWMNERLYAEAARMTDAERKQDRGAFFGSIHRTLNHILWADRVWISRFTGTTYATPAYGADAIADFADLQRERDAADTAILDLSGSLAQAWLDGTVEYRAGRGW